MSEESRSDGEVPASADSVRDSHRPSISIIVGTYRRREYIVGAVRSVFESGLAPDQLEVIVTKGYASPTQDKELSRLGARVVLDPESGWGERIMRALPLTRASLVAFLDDDDLFEKGRLEHVLRIFDAHPGVGFYRSRLTLIDHEGRPVPRELYGAMELDSRLDRTGPLKGLSGKGSSSFRVLSGCFPWFNTSSIVVRRELLTGPFGPLLESAEFAPDVRLYLIALLSGTAFYLDDRRLIRYRTSSPTWSELARRSWGDWASVSESARLAQRFLPSPWPIQFQRLARNAERRALWSDFVSRIEQREPRLALLSAFRRYLEFLVRHPPAIQFEPSRLFYLVCATIYLAQPSSGRSILRSVSMTPSISRTRRRVVRGDPPSVP
jgi:glycosyltransferase involved in cell wall biosynthesis